MPHFQPAKLAIFSQYAINICMLYPFSIPEPRFFSFAVLVPRTSSCRIGLCTRAVAGWVPHTGSTGAIFCARINECNIQRTNVLHGLARAQNMRLMIFRFLNVGRIATRQSGLQGQNRFCRLAVSEIHDFTGKEDEVGRVLANEEGERTIEHKSDLFAKCRAGR